MKLVAVRHFAGSFQNGGLDLDISCTSPAAESFGMKDELQ